MGGCTRGIKPVQDRVAGVFQSCERRLFREVVKMADLVPLQQDRPAAEHPLHGKVKRNMKYLVRRFAAQASEKAQIVFHMFEDVDAKKQAEMWCLDCKQVLTKKAEPLVLARFAQRKCLRRDLVAVELCRSR